MVAAAEPLQHLLARHLLPVIQHSAQQGPRAMKTQNWNPARLNSKAKQQKAHLKSDCVEVAGTNYIGWCFGLLSWGRPALRWGFRRDQNVFLCCRAQVLWLEQLGHWKNQFSMFVEGSNLPWQLRARRTISTKNLHLPSSLYHRIED